MHAKPVLPAFSARMQNDAARVERGPASVMDEPVLGRQNGRRGE